MYQGEKSKDSGRNLPSNDQIPVNGFKVKVLNSVVIKDDQKISITTPIMGFSNRIGVLIVEVK